MPNFPSQPKLEGAPLDAIILRARRRLIDMHYRANAGHIGGNLSCLDALLTLHHQVMDVDDRFVLSKGHSAGALYITLWTLGKLSDEDLKTFCAEGSRLPGHPSGSGIPGLLFSTGSLGHGPSLCAGLALAARYQAKSRTTYCLCSDGEWQEGACWEALIFAVHQKLDNLVILIDQNGYQGFGTTQEVISCSDLALRIGAFGATVISVDGHDPAAIAAAMSSRPAGRPLVVILNTIKGRGLHYEGTLESHYLPLSAEEYEAARARMDGEDMPS
jgi:transketolase